MVAFNSRYEDISFYCTTKGQKLAKTRSLRLRTPRWLKPELYQKPDNWAFKFKVSYDSLFMDSLMNEKPLRVYRGIIFLGKNRFSCKSKTISKFSTFRKTFLGE